MKIKQSKPKVAFISLAKHLVRGSLWGAIAMFGSEDQAGRLATVGSSLEPWNGPVSWEGRILPHKRDQEDQSGSRF